MITLLKYFSFLLAISLVISCKKETTNIDTSLCKLQTVTYNDETQTSYNVTYTNNLITELKSPIDKITFTYDGNNNLVKKEWVERNTNQLVYKVEFTVNTQGQIMEEKQTVFSANTIVNIGIFKYTYNANKLIETKWYDDLGNAKGFAYFTWTGDNPTTYSTTNIATGSTATAVITYDLNKENLFNTQFKDFMFYDLSRLINFYNEGYYNYIFLAKNTIKTVKQSSLINTDTLTHSFNSNNLPITIYTNSTRPRNVWKFTYDCP